MSSLPLCTETVWEPGGWNAHECGRPAKVAMGRGEHVLYLVCGIHARVLERQGYNRIGANA